MQRDRDSELVGELFARHERELGRFIAQLVRSRQLADDLLQEVSSVLWESFEKYDESRPFRAWAAGIVLLGFVLTVSLISKAILARQRRKLSR